ncbi:hypothetical protein [Bradyrhizobium sp.]|uniref:hypothetical protein n=1 Tax=Bradyrhizobium sp. TaxID=376 RepID=UPI00271BD734|nr:hypothetical protein [Bradyrhizobium sp.]MDO9294888.1 hypothetical protein [Bradyrhizobium sp.]
MAKKPDQKTDHLAGGFETENTGGVLTGFLAEEDEFDRRALWRLGSWGVASVGAVVLAVLANQSSVGWRRDQVAAADLSRQAQQIQSVARDSQSEARRLASAIETLNSDRDRLYSRVTVLEQGLDTATGAIARQAAAPAAAQRSPTWPAGETAAVLASPPPVVAPVATTAASAAEKLPKVTTAPAVAPEPAPATVSSLEPPPQNPPAASLAATPAKPLMAERSMMAPPDAAAGKLIEPEATAKTVTSGPIPEIVAAVGVDAEAEATAPKLQRTEFGVDVGGANSVGGLRALWRGLLKSRSNAPLAALRPIIVVKEGSGGLGLQLRLVAGPLRDAAAAAKICAALIENQRPCETTVFDGQRLSLQGDEPPAAVKPAPRKRSSARPKPTAAAEEPKKPEPRTLSSLFKRD